MVGQIFGHLGLAFTRGRLIDFKLGHLGVQIFGRLGKRPSLELERPSSRTASCRRIWPAKCLDDTKKKMSMCDCEAYSKVLFTISLPIVRLISFCSDIFKTSSKTVSADLRSECGCDRKLFNLFPTNVVRMSKTKEFLRSNNNVDTAQICAESGSKSGEKHSFLNTDLCMHDGPINVSGELQESRPTRGSLKELVSQSNVDTKVTTTQIVDGIINTINVIRYTFKKRPDTASISEYLERNNGVERNRVLQVLQSLTDRSRVHLNRVKGKDSYFIGIAPLP